MATKVSYPYIRAWGILLNGMAYYIRNQVELAEHSNAPEKAIYQNDNGTWATLDDCAPQTQSQVIMVAKAHGLIEES